MLVTARSITLFVMTSLLLVACGSSPPVRYYALTSSSAHAPQDVEDAAILGLGPLELPEYLNRTQIVTRGIGAELRVDEFSRWAEPLNLSLHRIVAANVDALLDNVVVVSFPYDAAIQTAVDYRLLGEVDRFDADRSGRVVLDVQWVISQVGSDLAAPPRRSHYQAQSADASDPASVAEAMNETLLLFSQDIADELASVL